MAAPSVSLDLTPPPPDFLVCKTVGSGTICQGARTLPGEPYDTGIVCGSGASAFHIWDNAGLHQRATRWYDSDGKLTRRMIHQVYSGAWFNPLTGVLAPYTQNQMEIDVLAVPGDFASSTLTVTGEIVMRSGPGAPVLKDVGRQVFQDGDLISSSGQHVFIPDNPNAFDAVCAALARTN